MRMRILMRPENSLANFSHQVSNQKLQIKCREGMRQRMRMALRMKLQNLVLAAEWKFATKFASDCECDGLVRSGLEIWAFCNAKNVFQAGFLRHMTFEGQYRLKNGQFASKSLRTPLLIGPGQFFHSTFGGTEDKQEIRNHVQHTRLVFP